MQARTGGNSRSTRTSYAQVSTHVRFDADGDAAQAGGGAKARRRYGRR